MNTFMKKIVLMTTVMSISANVIYANEEDHPETKLYFSSSEKANAFEHTLYDEKTGEAKESPLGNKKYPFAVVAEMDSKMFIPGNGKWAFKLGMTRAAFKQNQSLIEENLHNGFYVADESFVYLDSDMATIVTPEHAQFVLITDALAFHYETESIMDIKWNECTNSHFTGRYSGSSSCSSKRFLDDRFTRFLEQNILACANEGLAKAKKTRAASIYVIHDGTYGDSSHQKTRSLHNVGFAIDIDTLILKKRSGGDYTINYKKAVNNPKSPEMTFFKEFRLCWGKKTVQRDRACSTRNKAYNRRNGLNYQGTIGWEDSRHRKHIHVSHPICSGANKNSYYPL